MAILAANSANPYVCTANDQVVAVKLNLNSKCQKTVSATQLLPQTINFHLYNTGSPVTSFSALSTQLMKSSATTGWLYNIVTLMTTNAAATTLNLRDVMKPQLADQNFTSSLVGADTANGLPNSAAACLNFFTPFRGSGARGRLFIGPLSVATVVPASGTCGDCFNAAEIVSFNGTIVSADSGLATFVDGGSTKWQLVVMTLGGANSAQAVRQSQKTPEFNYQTQQYSADGGTLTCILEPVVSWQVQPEISHQSRRAVLNRRAKGIKRG